MKLISGLFILLILNSAAQGNALYFELFGKAELMSLNLEKGIVGNLAMGAGAGIPFPRATMYATSVLYGYTPPRNGSNLGGLIIPVYAIYLLGNSQWKPYVYGGANFTDTENYTVASLGIESRHHEGFLFRFGPYANFHRSNTQYSAGMSLGFAF